MTIDGLPLDKSRSHEARKMQPAQLFVELDGSGPVQSCSPGHYASGFSCGQVCFCPGALRQARYHDMAPTCLPEEVRADP